MSKRDRSGDTHVKILQCPFFAYRSLQKVKVNVFNLNYSCKDGVVSIQMSSNNFYQKTHLILITEHSLYARLFIVAAQRIRRMNEMPELGKIMNYIVFPFFRVYN